MTIVPAPAITLRDLGEQGLLQRLQRFCPEGFIGDDGAILVTQADRRLVVTTDVLVDGVHFSVGLANPIVTTPPHSAGWRSAAANLSDLAAMGATPLGITVGLSLPANIPVTWIEELYEGITDCLRPWNIPIVGGDIVRSQQLSLAITAFGEVHPDRILRRNAAKPGDAIVMTGVHGLSRAGLEILLGNVIREDDRSPWIQAQIRAHQYPLPRLDLRSHLPVPSPAGMDSSDGLADAVLQIARASRVGARLDLGAIVEFPILEEIKQTVGLDIMVDWVFYGGEDFELILCMSQESAREFCQNTQSIQIGIVTESQEVLVIDSQKKSRSLSIDRGFQHFR